ncbi:hypothetical protein PoB_002998600 [Plakobranchus ocellatus]|uniref:Uncharacterized protein n=1 Tax=Plakobranchus ocellatus TaxID=259542 RepID=A0AAV4A9Y0_9GAST|nr:hypothetical protein PoB_002998600 [Plakobranchus ocellatus]
MVHIFVSQVQQPCFGLCPRPCWCQAIYITSQVTAPFAQHGPTNRIMYLVEVKSYRPWNQQELDNEGYPDHGAKRPGRGRRGKRSCRPGVVLWGFLCAWSPSRPKLCLSESEHSR